MQSKTYVEDVSGSSVEWWSKWNVKHCSSFLVRSREDK